MADVDQPGPGWWQASDGNWYPPETHPNHGEPPAPGWWIASDGNWYPPQGQATPPTAQPAAPTPPLPPAAPTPPVLAGAVVVALIVAGVAAFVLLRSSDDDNGIAAGDAESARPTAEAPSPGPTIAADDASSGDSAPAATAPAASGDTSGGSAGAPVAGDPSCVYLGPDSVDDLHAELRFTMPFDTARDLDVSFALLDGSRQPFLISSAFVEAAQPGEMFRFDADTLESLPDSIGDDSAVTCEILAIEDFPFSEDPEVLGEAACEVTGTDSFGDVQVVLTVTNPTDMAADLSVDYALRGDGVRFQSGFTFIEQVAAGETIRSPDDSFTDAPDWARDLTCEIIDVATFDF